MYSLFRLFFLSISQQIRCVHLCVNNLIEDKKKRKEKGILKRDKTNKGNVSKRAKYY